MPITPALAALLHNPLIWRGDQLARAGDSIASGFSELDRELPGGGWPHGALTELLHDEEGIGELNLLMPALRRIDHSGSGASIVLIAPPHIPYAPAFSGFGVPLTRMLVIDVAADQNRWWAAEQVLRAQGVGALLFWPGKLGDQYLRRLQLAAQESKALAFIFSDTSRAAQASPSPLRVRLSIAGARLRVDVFKRRGGVMTRPLLLDMTSVRPLPDRFSIDQGLGDATSPKDCRVLGAHSTRVLTFKPHYPVGGPSAQIWNRALVRADEVRRGTGTDPRVSKDRHEAAAMRADRNRTAAQ